MDIERDCCREAFNRGIYAGWKRGVDSSVNFGSSAGNFVIDVVARALGNTKLPIAARRDVYRAVMKVDLNQYLGAPLEEAPEVEIRVCHGVARKRGEETNKSKLTEDDVREMRRRRAAGETIHKIARDYPSCKRWSISRAINGKTWAHVK